MKRNAVLASILVMGIVVSVVLGLHQTSQAAPQKEIPFNSVKQRLDMINELKGIAELLKEQNKLLKEQNVILQKQIKQTAGR